MPGYKGHLVGGIMAFAVLFFGVITFFVPQASHLAVGEWLLFALAGSLFPDIDVKSKGQKYFYYVVLVCLIILAMRQQFEELLCFSFIIIIPMLVRHRGIFHNPQFIIIISFTVWIIAAITFPYLARQLFIDTLFFVTGALSHLWLDFGTRQMMYKLTRAKKR